MVDLLKRVAPVYYWPNEGNLGDLLIAEATRQFFAQNKIEWKEYNPENPPSDESIVLVYGGGGRFVSHWGGLDELFVHLVHPRVKKGIILPHSFYDVDEFVQLLDDRHTIFCREKKSFEYLKQLSLRASVLLSDDMGMFLRLDELPDLSSVPCLSVEPTKEEERQKRLLEQGWVDQLILGVKDSEHVLKNKKIAFILRTDKEKALAVSSPFSYDVSLAWSSSCRTSVYNAYFLKALAVALNHPDIIVTDRLHVGVMGHLLGKTVYLIDNDYGKTSGIYWQSFVGAKDVHLLGARIEEWPYELYSAWMGFNSLQKALDKQKDLERRVAKEITYVGTRLDGQMNRQDAQRNQIEELAKRLSGVQCSLTGQVQRQNEQMRRQDSFTSQLSAIVARVNGQMNRQDAQSKHIEEIKKRLDGQMNRQDAQQQKQQGLQSRLTVQEKMLSGLQDVFAAKMLALCPEYSFLVTVYEVVLSRMRRRAGWLRFLACICCGKKKTACLEERGQIMQAISRIETALLAIRRN